MIPYGHQALSDEDIEAVVAVLRSDWLTQGPLVPRFESALAAYCGSEYAVAVSSGTAGLHVACLAAGLGPGDILWTSPITFVASANCALYCGAEVDFVDIDPATYNISVESLKLKLHEADRNGCLPKVLIPVHFAGQSCDMKAIAELADQYGFTVIDDACHALGGTFDGRRVGACHYSGMTVFSFHPVKTITSGEGGMVTTNSPELAKKMSMLRTHGITRDATKMECGSGGSWYYEQMELGFNYRMSDIHAALGMSQLKRLDDFVGARRHIAAHYSERLTEFPIQLPVQVEGIASAWHLYVIRLDIEALQVSKSEVVQAMNAAGVCVGVHYIPVHSQPYFRSLGFKWGDYPVAEQYYAGAMSLPIYPGLSDTEQNQVINAIYQILS